MKRIIQKTLALMAVLLGGFNASAYDFQAGGLYYNILSETEATVTVFGLTYDSDDQPVTISGDIVIPEKVSHGGKTYTVAAIGEDAFRFCAGLTSVTIPASVATIEDYTFHDCVALREITVAPDNPNYCSADGVLYTKDMSALIQYPCGSTATRFEIPNSVTTIESYAFEGCTGLTSVAIPNSVTTIESSAFKGCTGLTSVAIPNSVTTIGLYSAFEGCTGLTSVTIPASMTRINGGAFRNCDRITEINCEATTPPEISQGCFDDKVKKNATLYVPAGFENRYKEDWSGFTNIQPKKF